MGKLYKSALFLAPFALVLSQSGSVEAGEEYSMGGKAVPREFFEAGQLVNQGTALLRNNQNKEAADKLSRAVLVAPGMAEAHHDYALALAKLGQTQPALDQFKLALNLNPNLDSAWLSMGGLYQSSGNIPAALKAYKEFVTRFPRNPDAPKVASLMQGLQREYSNGGVAAPGTSSDKDYFAEATALGFVRWPASRMPIRIYIKDGSDVSGYKPSYDKTLRDSFDSWSNASGGLITFKEVKDPGDADIECSWLSDSHKLVNSAESGETRIRRNSAGIVHVTIQLLTVPTVPETPMTENRIRQITLHEIGHALGITGHTTNPSDSMFFSVTLEDRWKDLSARDAATIVRMYSQS